MKNAKLRGRATTNWRTVPLCRSCEMRTDHTHRRSQSGEFLLTSATASPTIKPHKGATQEDDGDD